jgi:hypothetical protein
MRWNATQRVGAAARSSERILQGALAGRNSAEMPFRKIRGWYWPGRCSFFGVIGVHDTFEESAEETSS